VAAPAALRNSTAELVRFAERDLTALWRTVDTPLAARAALMDVLPALVTTYGSAASTLASEWYDDERERRSAPGRFQAIPLDPSDRGARALAGWAAETAKDSQSLQALVIGGIQRRIADHMRLTIARSSVADPGARGWQREGSGRCDFCQMLIGRGAVYTEASADFQSHDSCGCYATPAF
jgi:hypothetical protein